MTLIATPKSTDANSLATLAQANLYHDARLHNTEWTSATDAKKEKALMMATRLINGLDFLGDRTTTAQVLSWPRHRVYEDSLLLDHNTIPQSIINATSELAFLLLIKDTTRDSGDKGFKSIKVGPIKIDPESSDRSDTIPDSVMDYLRPFVGSAHMIGVVQG